MQNMKCYYILGFTLLFSNFLFGQGNPKIEILANGVSVIKGNAEVLTCDDIDYSMMNKRTGCQLQKVIFGTSAIVASITTKNTIAFSVGPFRNCKGIADGDTLVLEINIVNAMHPLYGYSGRGLFVYRGSMNYYGDRGLNLVAPFILSVSDETICSGSTGSMLTATINHVPDDFSMEEYRLDWGDSRISTGNVLVEGGVATVTGVIREDVTETIEALFPRLLKNGAVLVVAKEPYKIAVKGNVAVSLRAELAGKLSGDEVFFEVVEDNRQENLTYRWLVNAETVAGKLDWFASDKLQEGDVVKCGVTGSCPGESFSNEIAVHFADAREEKWSDHSAVDNGGFRIPNVLTPNNDGVNDVWKLDFLQDYPDHLITIYDYTGKVVYQTRHYRNDWDGKVNDALMYGVYTCVINFGNERTLKTWLDVRTNNK